MIALSATFTILFLFSFININAQSFNGFATSNWSGVARIDVNPASIAEHMYRWDVALLGVNVYASNSLLYWDQQETRFTYKDDGLVFSPTSKPLHAFANAEVRLPQLMFSPNRNYTLAFGMRTRAVASVNNASGGINHSLKLLSNKDVHFLAALAHQELEAGFHAWNEIHATYARVLKRKESNTLKIGVTPKLLLGMAASHFKASSRDFVFTGKEFRLTGIDASLNQAGRTGEGMASPLGAGGLGVGVDVGFELEHNQWNYRKHYTAGRFSPAVCSGPNYLYRIGLAFLDLGAIDYKNGSGFFTPIEGSVAVNASSVSNLKSPEHVRDSAAIDVHRVSHSPSFRTVLPARAVLDVDYNLGKGFYANSQLVINLSSQVLGQNRTEMPHQLAITARWETSVLGVYTPVSVNQYGETDVGLALRAGPVVAGVHNMGALLWEKQPTHVGAFVMLKTFQFCKRKRVKCPEI